MRYKWIELIGYIGFYNGMGLNQINIDFTKCKYNKILIRGKNGAGKSSLLNAINPNPDNNDLFIPGMEARKSICIIDTNTEYLIRYIHPVNKDGSRGTTKGYISRIVNGQSVELNPNGNISSCKDILYEEFNLDSSYIALSKLSSENRGIVDNKPAERKKLLNNIINILDTYNSIYKNISKKVSVYKSNMNNLIYKLDSIGSSDNIVSQIDSISSQLDTLEKTKEDIIETIAAIKIKMQEYNQILIDNNYEELITELRSLYKESKIIESKINQVLEKYKIDSIDKVDDFLKYIESSIERIKSDIDHANSNITSLLSERDIDVRELQSKNERLSTIQGEYNYKDLKKNIEKCEALISNYEADLSKVGGNIKNITRVEYEEAMEAFRVILEESSEMTTHYDMTDVKYVIEHFMDIDSKVKEAKDLQKVNTKLYEEKNTIMAKIAEYKTNRKVAAELKNRPEGCTIDDCIYIRHALEMDKKYPEGDIGFLDARINEIDSQMNENYKFINKSELYFYIKIRIKKIKELLNSKYKYMIQLPIRFDFRETFFDRLVNMDPFKDVSDLYQYIDFANFIDDYNNIKKQYDIYLMEYKVYESKSELIDSIINDIEDLSRKTNFLDEEISKNNTFISENSKKLIELEDAYKKIKDISMTIEASYKPSKERIEELESIKSTLDDNTKVINELQNKLNISNTSLGEVTANIKRLSAEKETLNHKIILIEEYKRDLEIYRNKYTKLEKIRYYSSPSTGIQTLFIELYMNKIISTANDLLSMLFNGEFSLQPFIVNEAEFRIPCIGDGLLHDDISSMSTAQKCMISMILSFSILHQSSTKYNIISVDEIDGGLDTYNRTYFTSLLDRLMVMLQCEQCFIISHNDELNTSSADLILLKNDIDYSHQGNVIWKY